MGAAHQFLARMKEDHVLIDTAKAIRTAPMLTVLGLGLMVGELLSQNREGTQRQADAPAKIARALSAGPANITEHATVAEPDEHGGLRILRPGTNDFTCMPGDVTRIGMPPMCADKVAMQWNKDFEEHKAKPTTTVPGIEYMLAGATQRSDSDPFDKTSPPIKVGPHWMLLWPFDPKTSGLPTTHKATGAYIMWAGSPYAHVHVMGKP
jgi:hypothetical protein